MKMKRVLSRGTVLFIWLGFALFFFTAQISIFQVTSHVEETSAIPSLGSGEETVRAKSLLEVHSTLYGRCWSKILNALNRFKTAYFYVRFW